MVPLRRDLGRVARGRVGLVGQRRGIGQRHLDNVMREGVPIVNQLLDVVDQDEVKVVTLVRRQPAWIVQLVRPDALGIVSHLGKDCDSLK